MVRLPGRTVQRLTCLTHGASILRGDRYRLTDAGLVPVTGDDDDGDDVDFEKMVPWRQARPG